MKISSVVDVFNENMHFDSIKAIDTEKSILRGTKHIAQNWKEREKDII